MSMQDIDNLDEDLAIDDLGHIESHEQIARGMKTLKLEVTERLSEDNVHDNVELSYAQLSTQITIPNSWSDIEGLSITFSTNNRPVMVKIYLGIAQASDTAIFQFESYRQSDNKGLADSVSSLSSDKQYQPIPMFEFRVPAGQASDTYRIRATRLAGTANGLLNFTEKIIFIQAVQV